MSGTPAGWHPDPHRHAALRYWDGAQWTDHTADGQPGGVPAGPSPSNGGPLQMGGTLGLPPQAGTTGYGAPHGRVTGGGGSKRSTGALVAAIVAVVVIAVVLVIVLSQ